MADEMVGEKDCSKDAPTVGPRVALRAVPSAGKMVDEWECM